MTVYVKKRTNKTVVFFLFFDLEDDSLGNRNEMRVSGSDSYALLFLLQ